MKPAIVIALVLTGSIAIGMEKDPRKELYKAIRKKRFERAIELIGNDKTLANADFSVFCKKKRDETGDNETPLLAAIRQKNYSESLFYTLLEAGANVNQAATSKLTPLFKALLICRGDLALLLLDHDADTYSKIDISPAGTFDALELAVSMQMLPVAQKIRELREPKQVSPTTN